MNAPILLGIVLVALGLLSIGLGMFAVAPSYRMMTVGEPGQILTAKNGKPKWVYPDDAKP